MPFVNIYTIEKNILTLESIIPNLKEFIAKKLICKERVLNSNEISVRLIVPSHSSQIAETELVITAHHYPERIKDQDKICLEIKNFIMSKCLKTTHFGVWNTSSIQKTSAIQTPYFSMRWHIVFLISKINSSKSIYVWLQLCELGHSSEQ